MTEKAEKTEKAFTVVLAGNPNCGKTVVFNALTGSRQRVGNWPGVTVEKKTGLYREGGHAVTVVDLPGTYSTSVVSATGAVDESIACRYLLSGEPDIIVNIVDASHLERHLYLTLQLLEMRIPMILAVNMLDMLKQHGRTLDLKQLSQTLGCPVVGLIATQGDGLAALKQTIIATYQQRALSAFSLPLPTALGEAIRTLSCRIAGNNTQWLAMRLLEGDLFAAQQVPVSVVDFAPQVIQQVAAEYHEDPDILIANARYTFIHQCVEKITQFTPTSRQTLTQWIDRIVLHRWLGIPIFLGVMYVMFLFAINIGGAFQDFFDISSSAIFVNGVAYVLTQWHWPMWLIAVLANGVGRGINTTVTFIPVLGAMFLFLAWLEDSGYMARAAFVMDRCMRAVGLPGKSFVPMIVGFGCNVPAVMGARTLENRRDRVLTVLMMPFMSCGARLAIFAVFASAFFPRGGAAIIFILYCIGILIAVLSSFVLRKTVLPGKPAPLVMELPSYHWPRWGSLIRQAWQRLKSFLIRAGSMIIPVCVVIGVLNSVTVTGQLTQEGGQHSLLSQVGRVLTPVFTPLGIQASNWPATVGLVTGVLAKEVVVGTLNTLYSSEVGQKPIAAWSLRAEWRNALESIPNNLGGLSSALKNPVVASEAPHEMSPTAYGVMYTRFMGPVGAFAYLLFVLLYFPCISTLATMRREIGGKWSYFSLAWSTGLAYALSVITYQLLTLTAHPLNSWAWTIGMIGALTVVILLLKRYADRGDAAAGPLTSHHYVAGN